MKINTVMTIVVAVVVAAAAVGVVVVVNATGAAGVVHLREGRVNESWSDGPQKPLHFSGLAPAPPHPGPGKSNEMRNGSPKYF